MLTFSRGNEDYGDPDVTTETYDREKKREANFHS